VRQLSHLQDLHALTLIILSRESKSRCLKLVNDGWVYLTNDA
jgi:hypothetical protein